jgi:hypothetical protein
MPHQMQGSVFCGNDFSCLHPLLVSRIDALARIPRDAPEMVVQLVEDWRVELLGQKLANAGANEVHAKFFGDMVDVVVRVLV